MDGLFFIAIVVLIIIVIRQHGKNKELSSQINYLNSQLYRLNERINDLYGKSFYNYKHLENIEKSLDLTDDPLTKDSLQSSTDSRPLADKPIRPPVTQPKQNKPPIVNNSQHGFQQNPVQSVNNAFNPYNSEQNTKPLSSIPQIFKDSKENIHSQSVTAKSPVKAYSVNKPAVESITAEIKQPKKIVKENIQTEKSVQREQTVQSTVNVAPKKSDKKQDTAKSIENWLGTRLFNIVASLLIFIGLILFCTLGYEYITDGMKIAAMFIVSSAFIGMGAFFTRQNKSIFSLGLTGCGFGTFFISILLTHVYFHAINDITAFSLLMLWGIFALFMSKKLDSLLLSVTAHLGMAVSICFAFSLGFSPDRIILPVVYQIASIAVIVIGNIFCCKKTYRFGLFMSMGLLIYTTFVMCTTFAKPNVIPNIVSVPFTITIFAVQTLAISFISYLISVSTAVLENEDYTIKYPNLPVIIHSVNKSLWTVGMFESVGCTAYIVMGRAFGTYGIVCPTFAICAVTLCHLFITLLISEKLNFSEKLAKLSIWFNSVLITIMLLVQSIDRKILHDVPFVFVYALLLMLIIKYTKNKKLNHLVSFVLGCEMLFLCFYGYMAIANVVISILYMVAVGIVILMHWFGQSGLSRENRFTLFKTTEYLWISVSIIPINVSQFSDISLPLILTEFAVMNIIAYLCKYAGEKENLLRITVKTESLLTLYLSLIAIANNQNGILGEIPAIKAVLVLTVGGLLSVYAYDFVKSKSTALQMVVSASVSAYITAICIGFSNIFTVAYLFKDVLNCRPFFFFFALTAFAIYLYTRNKDLSIYLTIPLGIDMLLMLLFGYKDLIYEVNKSNTPIHINLSFIAVLYLIATSAMMYILWKTQPKDEGKRYTHNIKTIEYFWIVLSTTRISMLILSDFTISYAITILLVTAINMSAFLINYGGKEKSILNVILKIHLGINMVMAVFRAYPDLLSAGYSRYTATSRIYKFSVFIPMLVLCLIYMSATVFIIYHIWNKLDEENKPKYILPVKTIEYIWLNLSVISIVGNAFIRFSIMYPTLLIILTSINIIGFFINYSGNNRRYLDILMKIHLGADMFLMLFSGYFYLFSHGYIDKHSYYLPTFIPIFILAVIYTSASAFTVYYIWKTLPEDKKSSALLPAKTIGYFWTLLSAMFITVNAIKGDVFNSIMDIHVRIPIVITVLLIVNVATLIIKYVGEDKNYLEKIVKGVSIAVMYFGILMINVSVTYEFNATMYYAVKFILILASVAIFYLLAREYVTSNSILRQVFIGITATLLVDASCNGLTNMFEIAYIFSIVSMVTALACIVTGFVAKAKGLRIYGLLVIMLCVIKLVTVDISAADSMARVAAFVIGGIVCFIISGIYNQVERKLMSVDEEQN